MGTPLWATHNMPSAFIPLFICTYSLELGFIIAVPGLSTGSSQHSVRGLAPSSWERHLKQENSPPTLDVPSPLNSICLQNSEQIATSSFVFHPSHRLHFPAHPLESLSWADLLFMLLISLLRLTLPSQASRPPAHIMHCPCSPPCPPGLAPSRQGPVYFHKPEGGKKDDRRCQNLL